MAVFRVRRYPKASTDSNYDAASFHQSGDALLPDTNVLVSELSMDAWAAIGCITGPMNELDPREQAFIFLRTLGRGTISPCVVPGLRHLEHTTHHAHAVLAHVSSDARVSQRDSLVKKTTVFFRKSRSSVTRLRSRRSACTSSSCELIFPLPGNAARPPRSRSRRHLCS